VTVRRIFLILLVVLRAVEHVWLLAPTAKRLVFPPKIHPAVEGREIANRLGCLGCHGADAGGGFVNRGADGDVPALAGGEKMMWATSEQELREWILHGHILDDEIGYEPAGFDAGQGSGRAVVMPAFDDYIDARELDLLIEWLRAISGLQFPDDAVVQQGMDTAHEVGCFDCHGPMGTGGVNNPGSLKGYVPGFFGEDYHELVADDAELRQWIENGISDRFAKHLIAGRIIKGQALKMPAYAEHLSDEELDSVVALVQWLASSEWEAVAIP
jgi:mono/diheme cytochrome c family protein